MSKEKFVFNGETLAEVRQNSEDEWIVFYNNKGFMFLGAAKLLADWEIEMYEKYKHL